MVLAHTEEIVVRPGLKHYLYLELGGLYEALARAAREHPLPKEGAKVLDLGCGWRKYDHLFPGARIIGLEPSANGKPDLLGRGEQLPFKDASLDAVLCTQVIQYFDDPFAAVEEIKRVRKKVVLLLLSGPRTYPLMDLPEPKWRFMPNGFQRLFGNFSRVEVRPIGGFIWCYFQILNLYLKNMVFGRRPWENWLTKRLMWLAVFPVMNTLGKTLDRWFYNPRASISYLVVAQK